MAQTGRRVANFAMVRPAREILFTSSAREDRDKAKNFIDTGVYRGRLGGKLGICWSHGILASANGRTAIGPQARVEHMVWTYAPTSGSGGGRPERLWTHWRPAALKHPSA